MKYREGTEQLRVLNQCGNALYAPVDPCTSHVNLENNNESHDPIYDHELYLDNVAAMLFVTRYWKTSLIAAIDSEQ